MAAYNAHEGLVNQFIPIPKPQLNIQRKIILGLALFLRIHQTSYSLLYGKNTLARNLSVKTFDVIIANDIEALPLAFTIKSLKGVILDAHEYSPRQFENKLIWRLLFQPLNLHICQEYIKRIAAMTTIGKGIAEEYKKNFHCDPIVINNAAWSNNVPISEVTDSIRIIHHGGATVSRHLENMIEMMQYLDHRFTLDLMLVVP
ncbi:MAG: hypothetical protein ACKOE6_06935, partial [Flammeovirgaceae bacterium]